MKIIASKLSESVLCTLPNGEQVEVTMLCAQEDDCFAEPNVEVAIKLMMRYFDLALS